MKLLKTDVFGKMGWALHTNKGIYLAYSILGLIGMLIWPSRKRWILCDNKFKEFKSK